MHDGVFYCMPHSSSVLLSSLATITGHSLISTPRYRYERLKTYSFETSFREKARFHFSPFERFPFEFWNCLELIELPILSKQEILFRIFNLIAKPFRVSRLRKHEAEFTNCSNWTSHDPARDIRIIIARQRTIKLLRSNDSKGRPCVDYHCNEGVRSQGNILRFDRRVIFFFFFSSPSIAFKKS